jgi:hypothetical protein
MILYCFVKKMRYQSKVNLAMPLLILLACLFSGNAVATSNEQLDKEKEKNVVEDVYLSTLLLTDQSEMNLMDWRKFCYPEMPANMLNPNIQQFKGILGLGLFSLLTFILQFDLSSKHSQTEFGWGFNGMVGGPLKDGNTSLYLLGSAHRYSFDSGHDNLLQIGLQGRRNIGNDTRFWAGAEAGWVRDKTVSDYAGEEGVHNPIANGFFAGVLGGYKLPVKGVDMSAFAGISLINFGDFKADDHVIEEGHTSFQIKIGVEVGLPLAK